MFKYDWSQFDAKLGLIFMAGVLIVFNAMGGSDFAWYAAGVSALLAWLTILLGAVAVIFPTDNLYVQGGIHDANGSPTQAGFDTFFDEREYFVAGEVGWVSSFDRRRQDNYHLTVWHTDERTAKGTPSGWGLTAALQRYFNDQIMPFLRYSYSDGGATPMDHLVTGGLAYRVRGHNGFGVGLSWASPSDSELRSQFGIESMYRFYLAQTISVIPGLQVL